VTGLQCEQADPGAIKFPGVWLSGAPKERCGSGRIGLTAKKMQVRFPMVSSCRRGS
jgi:hypothetical protein